MVSDSEITFIHTYKLYLTTLASTTVGRLISMRGVKYKINYLQEMKKYDGDF
jgi:hypothetical protein